MNFIRTIFAAALMAATFSASAIEIEYTPTTTWPYLYEHFQEGFVTTFRGETMHHKQLNISLAQRKAHFLQNDKLMELDTRTIAMVTIGEDEFIPVSGALVKIIKKTEHGTTALSITINVEAMTSTEVGYGGKSTVSSTQKVSPNVIGAMNTSEHRSLTEMAKQEGKPLVLRKIRGIIYNRMFIPAAKYDILNIDGIDKNAVKKFMKDNKIRLSDDEDLSQLAEYIGTL